ncbi:COP9 signalosome complex subunit 8-like [Biomphalaria glabrata]|uniref:COP9 signalosome complex subunit 8-like n=1 Tax=Biomphalaria glabrata TaxID=6526 RepID=A0A9W2Z4B7_BIOGL|nr:COP9 signalosome complex subunit 8-like [Biomphalaria glabrata]KAI8738798.1 COP9 signalosome complex subunit 8-like [Biomphalaria glabrata]
MAAAVNTMDYSQLGSDLERQELEFGASPASPLLYCQLLAVYVLQNDLCNAKFLWKRIPLGIKQNCPELVLIWHVVQKMWLKDYAGTYEALQKEWSDDVKNIMLAVEDSVRARALRLVQLAYSNIHANEFATFVGMNVDKAVQAAADAGWQVDNITGILIPKPLDPPAAPPIMNEQHLSVLTQYVTYMEN